MTSIKEGYITQDELYALDVGLHSKLMTAFINKFGDRASVVDFAFWMLDSKDCPNGPNRLVRMYARSDNTAKAFFRAGVQPNISDHKGNTPLFWALTDYLCNASVKTLLELGANVNHANHAGESPLIIIFTNSYLSVSEEILKQLLKAGADPFHFDNKGMTALAYAMRRGNTQVIEILAKAEREQRMKLVNARKPAKPEEAQGKKPTYRPVTAHLSPEQRAKMIRMMNESADQFQQRQEQQERGGLIFRRGQRTRYKS